MYIYCSQSIPIWTCYMGVSENVVYPIVPNGFADHYPVFKWLAIVGNINPTFSDKPIYSISQFYMCYTHALFEKNFNSSHRIGKIWDFFYRRHFRWQNHGGLSENVGLIFPTIASLLKTGLSDQQNHWVQWGTQHFQTHPWFPVDSL